MSGRAGRRRVKAVAEAFAASPGTLVSTAEAPPAAGHDRVADAVLTYRGVAESGAEAVLAYTERTCILRLRLRLRHCPCQHAALDRVWLQGTGRRNGRSSCGLPRARVGVDRDALVGDSALRRRSGWARIGLSDSLCGQA
jgi:hypothetical protein